MNYDQLLKDLKDNYIELNKNVMNHTLALTKQNEILSNSISESIKESTLYYETRMDKFCPSLEKKNNGEGIIVTKKRTLEAARAYVGQKVAVLNFANNHSIGGSPWYAGAQEESMCRISTLYPCLEHYKNDYYDYHKQLYDNGKLDELGNNDVIYIPNVLVFKEDESAPRMLDKNDWYNVDVITCAAPQNFYGCDINKLEEVLKCRIQKILDVAEREGVEVLILGAWGCGAFHNSPELIAKLFKEELQYHNFKKVEFAIFCRGDDTNYRVFEKEFSNK